MSFKPKQTQKIEQLEHELSLVNQENFELKREIQELRAEKQKRQEDEEKYQKLLQSEPPPRYWTPEEHKRFLEALEKHDFKNGPYLDAKAIAKHVKTRTITQVRTHAQKYFVKLEKNGKLPNGRPTFKRTRLRGPELKNDIENSDEEDEDEEKSIKLEDICIPNSPEDSTQDAPNNDDLPGDRPHIQLPHLSQIANFQVQQKFPSNSTYDPFSQTFKQQFNFPNVQNYFFLQSSSCPQNQNDHDNSDNTNINWNLSYHDRPSNSKI